MVEEEKDYSEYSITKTYSIKIKNVKRIEEVNLEKGFHNLSKALNYIIENYEDKK